MAILNFPDNPQSGDQYTGDNGTTYIFDGVKWVGHAISQPAGTNSITNNGYTVQVDADGNLIIPTGSHVLYQDGTALAGAQGPQGVKGDTGDSGTVDVGMVTTGIAGSSAIVSNIGTPTAAVFEFTIPRGDKGDRGPAGTNGLNGVGDKGDRGDKGDKGDQGVSVTLQGTKATIADLPAAPVNPNDFAGHGWIVTTGDGDAHLDGSLWFWNITDQVWNDIGQIQGPQGLKGDRGDRGLTGDAGQNGLDGAGVATGGSTGQILSKVSGNDFDTHWVTNDRLTAGVVSVVLNGGDSKLHIPGYLLTPYGGLRVNAIDEGLSVDSWGASSLQLTSNGNLNKWVFGVNGILNLPHATDTPYDSVIGATYNINLNANGSFTKFASDGYMEIPGIIRAQQGNDLNLKAYNPTVDGVPGGVALTLQNYDVDSDSRTTQFTVGAQDVVVTTDFSGAGNQWTFAHDGSLTVPTNGRVNFGQPTLREPSWGARHELITLYDFNTSGQVNYGIGVSDNAIWMSTDTTTAGFKWFGGEGNLVLDLKGDGELNIVNNIRQGDARINLNENGVGAVYLTPTTDDYSAFYLARDNAGLYTQGNITLSNVKTRTSLDVVNIGTSNDNTVTISVSAYSSITQVTGTDWTMFYNNTNYSINSIAVDTPSAGFITFTINGNITVPEQSWVTFHSPTIWNDWNFDANGDLTTPFQGRINQGGTSVVNVQSLAGNDPHAPFVIYTSQRAYASSIKMVIQIEGWMDGDDTGWHSQACEALVSARGAYINGTEPVMTVYGVVYTGANPMATISIRRNQLGFIEVLATYTQTRNNGLNVSVHATEMFTLN